MSKPPAILCLSHLRWDHVWQRPQQIFSRLAAHFPVAFVHEPAIAATSEGHPEVVRAAEYGQLTAWQPVFPDRPDVIDRWREEYVRLVQGLLVGYGWLREESAQLVPTRPLISWYYTPTPWYFLEHVPSSLVVYDVMDDLASFSGASADLRQREARLLDGADLVFAGGKSLYEHRRCVHPSVHLFPSGVDAEHFARARALDGEIPNEIAHLQRPVLGYYGVIDERIDLELIRELAALRPDWTIVMVGPVAKIDATRLPSAPNLQYLGPQPYERLPSLLRCWDVCLMPFAINESTRCISPTKALEYMAAHKPIVSTRIPDVVANWSSVVWLAEGAAGFSHAVQGVLGESTFDRLAREDRESTFVRNGSWDRIVEDMRRLICAGLTRRVAPDYRSQIESPWLT